MGPALAGKLGEAGAFALRAGSGMIASNACSERAVWVEVDLGVGLREVRSSNLRMYRAGA